MSDLAYKRKITKSQLLNIILVMVLILVVGFGYLYYKKTSLVTAFNQILPTVNADPQPPQYIYSIYGPNNNHLSRPRTTTVFDNRIYVADTKNSRIMVFDYTGKYIQEIGGPKSNQGGLKSPNQIAFYNNQLFVADHSLGKIAVFALDGKFLGTFGDKNIKTPAYIKVVNDRFYVFDTIPQKLHIMDTQGKILKTFGSRGGENGQTYFANGFDVDKEGNIYIADSNSFRIQVFTSDGKFKAVWKGQKKDNSDGYTVPRGIAFDKNGNVWTANALAGGVSVSNAQGKRLALFTQGESAEDNLTIPSDVFIDNNSRLYVTETGSSRILVYQIK